MVVINGEPALTIGECLMIIEQHIFEKKGVRVKVAWPTTQKEIEFFEKLINGNYDTGE